MVGSALQHTRIGREEEAGEAVKNREAGTRVRSGIFIPKERTTG